MGCGGSTEKVDDNNQAKKSRNANSGDKLDLTPTPTPGKKYAPGGEEDDPDQMTPLSRKESAAKSADEPSDFVAKMKQMYQVRKAKFNGANEDLNQYEDEIRESIPVLTKRDRQRVQDWVNSIGAANPDNVFDDIDATADQTKQASPTSQQPPSSATSEPVTSVTSANAADGSTGHASSDVHTTPAVAMKADPSPPTKTVSPTAPTEAATHPNQIYDPTEIVPLLQVTSVGNSDRSPKDPTNTTPHAHRSRVHTTHHENDPHDTSFSSQISKSRRESVSMTSGGMMTPQGHALDATNSERHSQSDDGSACQDDSGGMKLGW